ncbi:MAG: YajQ family cyclic di-GMP-binding protein [Gammaproteobacteria bacterium]|nr:YajQ family cyclic di-GMP-binding protein [Gammaproteobacteria bacterium]
MPSFDVVSEINTHELTNAVDQANRELAGRYDFRGSEAKIELADNALTLHADNEFQIKQLVDIVYTKLAKRGIDIDCVELGKIEGSGFKLRQKITIRHGIDAEAGRKIVALLKTSPLKLQVSIQGDKVRVTGKKRDDLQTAIASIRGEKLGLPLQFVNFRD